MEVLMAGVTAPTEVGDLIWYGLSAFISYFLWSIKSELTGLRTDLKVEREAREHLALELASMKSRCDERHKSI